MAFEKQYNPVPEMAEPICVHMRTKGMYVRGDYTDAGELGEGASHCWCNLTQRVMGPDNLEVIRETCTSQRACYEGRL